MGVWSSADSIDSVQKCSRSGISRYSHHSGISRSDSRSKVTSQSEITQSRPDHAESRASAIKTTRIVLCLSFLVLAAVFGVTVFFVFSVLEESLALEQFESIVGQATSYVQQTTKSKRLGVMTMADIIGTAHANAKDWPFVLVDGYDHISSRLVQTISGDGMGFAPIVRPDELLEFEEFAYDSYDTILKYPNTTGVSSFGKGVWAKDIQGIFNVEANDQKYHEGIVHPNGETTYDSPFNIFTPIIQHSDGHNAKPLMSNLHYERKRGQTIDNIIDCSLKPNNGTEEKTNDCGRITDILLLTQRKKPAVLIMQPIFPARDPLKITGIISSPLVWDDVLRDAFGTNVNGIHCVLTSRSGITYTYYVMGGIVSLLGEGDLHEMQFSKYEERINLTETESDSFRESSSTLTLRIYPNEEFMRTYHTNNPLWGGLISIFIITFTTVVFFVYDRNVRGEFNFKNELLEGKRNFIRFVSHEVRTPLNAVCMGLLLMREEFEKSSRNLTKSSTGDNGNASHIHLDKISEWEGVTNEILGNAQNAVDVLNDLLNYDKITTRSLKLELSVLKTDILMDHAKKEFKVPAAKKKIDIAFEDNASPPCKMENLCIVGDDVRLIQVLRNLMSNAMKFTTEGGNVKVSLAWVKRLPNSRRPRTGKRLQHLVQENKRNLTLKGEKISFTSCGFLQLSVADTGAGMSPDQMAVVFEQGTQFNVNELQAGQGSGLGLYIAKGIMDQHLGSLTVSSEGLGKGTVFTMTLPVYNYTKQKQKKTDIDSDSFHFKASKTVVGPQHGCSKLRILVVDDSDTNRKFLTRILQNHGHTCDQAKNGSEAVDAILKSIANDESSSLDSVGNSNNHYDAILLDFEMPIMNGPTAAKKMRELGSDTFIVGITGNVLPEDVDHFKSQGANEVLPKPFNISDLEEILMEYGVGYRGKSQK